MQNLEKILEEIDREIEERRKDPEMRDVDICYGLNRAKDIIRKHMNDGWIPVEERLPGKEYYTALCVTDKNHYCVAVYNREYGFRTGDIDVEGEIIAWMPLPEPYRPEPLETRKELEEDSKGARENE